MNAKQRAGIHVSLLAADIAEIYRQDPEYATSLLLDLIYQVAFRTDPEPLSGNENWFDRVLKAAQKVKP